MADANPSRVAQDQLAGAVDALFAEEFTAEVVSAFLRSTATMDKVMMREISGAKSAHFPVIGQVNGRIHTPGTEILGQNVEHSEKIIVLDDLVIADIFLSQIDDLKNHYDVRSEYTRQMGNALARAWDTNQFLTLINAARSPANLTTYGTGGSVLVNDDFKIDPAGAADVNEQAQAIYEALWEAMAIMDENDIPPEDRWCALRPREYNALVQGVQSNGFSPINVDYTGGIANGSVANGTIKDIAGVPVFKTNQVPKADLTGLPADDPLTPHALDCSQTIGAIWHRSAAGTLKLLDMALEIQWDFRRQGWLLIGKFVVGMDVLQPMSAIELQLDTLFN